MSNYHIRLSWSYEELKGFTQKLLDNSSALVIYEHTEQSRIHIHIWVKSVSVITQTLKNWIKEILRVDKVNKDQWSFTTSNSRHEPWTDELITYLSKGKLEPQLVKGFTQDQIDTYKSKWIERTKPASAIKDGSKHKDDDKITLYQLAKELSQYIDMEQVENAYDVMNNNHDHSITALNTNELTFRKIVNKCISLHNKYNKTYCDFSLIKVIQTAQGICKSEKWKNQLINRVLEKLNPHYNE